MSGRIPEEKIQEIRERTDIVEVVSSYLPLKHSGANHLGLCPFHSEKTPSFNVNSTRQIFHCFGCGVGGNVFTFLMRMEGISFPEAAKRLGERVGIEVEEQILSPAEEKRREENDRLLRINEVACDFFHHVLMEEAEGEPARQYLKKRGYGQETARKFRLGYAPNRWESLSRHLMDKGFDPRWARQLGLIRPGKQGRGDFDLFRHRVIFPIIAASGKVVAFGGRVLDDSLPKYINSPESAIYQKGSILYGLYQARDAMRQSGEGIIVEGYFDQLALYRAGHRNAIATCGTALTSEHARLIKRYAKRLLLLFDQDSAGQKATVRAMDVLLSEGVSASVITLETGEDPDSFLLKRGREAFQQRQSEARPVLEIFIDWELAKHGDNIEGKARAAEEITTKIRLLPSEIERNLYLKLLAEKTGLDESVLRQSINSRSRFTQPAEAPRASLQKAPRRGRSGPKEKSASIKAQEILLHLMILEPQVCKQVAQEGFESLFCDQTYRAIAEKVLALTETENELNTDHLFAQLNEEQNGILSGILIKDKNIFAENFERIFNDCQQTTKKERLKRRSNELKTLIRQAEQSGSQKDLADWQAELTLINRQLKSRTI